MLSVARGERFDSVISMGMLVGDAVVVPGAHDVGDQLRLLIKPIPGVEAGIVGVMLEREEGEVAHAVMRLEVFQKPAKPGGVAVLVGPEQDVGVLSLEGRAAQLQVRIDTMQRCGKFQVKGAVVFRRHVLAVDFFAHFDVGDGVMTGFEVFDFRSGIVRDCHRPWRWERWPAAPA